MEIFPVKNLKKSPNQFSPKKKRREYFFMEEELQSALKTFLAEGDKVSRADWGLL